MPYGYFQFVRFSALVGFGYIGYEYFQMKEKQLGYIFFSLAILFQPFLKISLGRELWNIVDVGVAIYLLVTLLKPKNTSVD